MTLLAFPKRFTGYKKSPDFLRPYQGLFQKKIVNPGEEPGRPPLHDQVA
jgi:hypothetical protein